MNNNNENRICQNCKKDFTIEPDDFAFYEKMKVPAPTWCPSCRLWRRLSQCSERYLYQNKCGLCGQKIISMYPQGTTFPVYCLDCYRSDKWPPLSYGKDYDFKRPFFEQFHELKNKIPRAERVQQGDANGSSYCNRASYNKNCYLLARANYNENCYYSYMLSESQDCVDCFNVDKSQLAHQSIDSIGCYNIKYCQESRQCRDSFFLFDCRNCANCVCCVGLRNKQYHIFNKAHTKSEYEQKLAELELDTYPGILKVFVEFEKFLKDFFRESIIQTNCVNISGNWLTDCKDVKNSYQSRGVENGKNLIMIFNTKDVADYTFWGRNCELIYETANCGYDCSRIRFTNESWDACHDLTYCDNCYVSQNLFGCVGIRKGSYCILNKQYTKEEYEELVPKIIQHMNDMPYTDKGGRAYSFGEFFPPELSASAYNTTAAYEHFPLSQKEAVERGLAWEELKEKEHSSTILWKDLPEKITDVKDDILKETILCRTYDAQGVEATKEHNCTKAFKITKDELAFYRRMNIPLPQDCPNSRHFKRFKKRNPLKLWDRACAKCGKEIETSYAPERPEIVYCEQCYQNEVA